MASQKRKVRINVGGKIFETTATTLSNAGPDSFLVSMLDDVWSSQYEESGEYFIDRDPSCFHVLLHFLRTGHLHIPPTISDSLLYREAHYYGFLDQIRSAKYIALDGEKLKLSSSITGRALFKDTNTALIKASTNGGCSISNGRVFHVYDWMLQEVSTMNLDYMKIVDMEFYDSERIFISGRKNTINTGGGGGIGLLINPQTINTGGGGGIGLFNPQTAELKHKFSFSNSSSSSSSYDRYGNTNSCLTPGNLAIGSDNKMFCCYKDEPSKNTGGGGGIGLFNPQTAELKPKFIFDSSSSYDRYGNTNSCFTPGNLAIGSDNKMFFGYKDEPSNNTGGIGIWDIITGKQIDFLGPDHIYSNFPAGFGDSIKLQWLPSTNCLMAAMRNPQGNRISIIDLRMKKEMLFGFDRKYEPYKLKHGGEMTDAIGIEEMSCVCVIDQIGRFGFVDFRTPGVLLPQKRDFEKENSGEFFPNTGEMVRCRKGRPKLGWHGSKLFCSINDTISVFCGSQLEWELASQVPAGESICDFSIGGDRLFTLQHDHLHRFYGFDVWETPPPLMPPILI